MSTALRYAMVLLVLVNLGFVLITEAASWTWLATLAALTLAAPLLQRLTRFFAYRMAWNLAVIGAFTLLVRHLFTAGAGFDEIHSVVTNNSTHNLSIFGNTLGGGAGTIHLDSVMGNINITQDAPGSGAGGLDVLNGIPAINVVEPTNPINYNQPAPPTP